MLFISPPLVSRVLETVVGGETVVDQGAGEVQTDDLLQGVGAAFAIDEVTSGLVTDRHVEPDGSAPQPPPGFVGGYDLRLFHRQLDLLVNRFEFVRDPQDGSCAGAGGHIDAGGFAEEVGDLAVRHARLFVEDDDGRLGVGADLAGGGADGVGGLQGMPAADAATAFLAGPLVDAELAANRFVGQIGLELLVDVVVFADVPAAMRTVFGQRRFERLVDGLGFRRRPMGVRAVLVARLATGLFGFRLRFALGKGARLPLARARRLVEPLLELGDPLFEPVVLELELSAPRA